MAQREQELLEEKRNEILSKKQAKADEVLGKAQKIAQLRAKAEKESAAKYLSFSFIPFPSLLFRI
jgi:hypothetical protein